MDDLIMMKLTIGNVAKTAGVGVETVRFYERKGLIEQPFKPQYGFRSYPPQTVERIRFIRQAQELGFSLREIEELLSLRMTPGTDCSDIRERAVVKLADVDRKVEALTKIREALTEVIAACPGQGTLECCSIIGAMEKRDDEMETLTLRIDGLVCEGCDKRLTKMLMSEGGVRRASVSHADNRATVAYSPGAITKDRLQDIITNAGFTVIEG